METPVAKGSTWETARSMECPVLSRHPLIGAEVGERGTPDPAAGKARCPPGEGGVARPASQSASRRLGATAS